MPEKCRHCGEELEGEDAEPYRRQIVEIPRLSPYVIEHQQHQLECACCGKKTRGALPCEVPSTGYGDRLAAMVGWLSGEHRQSHRMVKSLMATLFSVELSRGSINRLRRQVSEAVKNLWNKPTSMFKDRRWFILILCDTKSTQFPHIFFLA